MMLGRLAVAVGVGILGVGMGGASAEDGRKIVDAGAVARLPHPGTTVPAAIAFGPDGHSVSFLKAERPDSLSRVVWRVGVAEESGPPVVAGRPPDEGTTEETVSPEEALRRERQRLRETGIAQISRSKDAGVAIIPLQGDLYLLKDGATSLERLTRTDAPEIDPQPSPDGTKVGYVRGDELHVLDLASRGETTLTSGAEDGLTHGLAEFIAQEELDRSSGFWWAPDGSKLAYQETDERHVPPYEIAHQGGDDYSVESHRYPFAGAPNAKVRLGVVGVAGGPTRWLDFGDPGADIYLARVDWQDPDHLLIQVLNRDQKVLRLVRLDVATGERSTLIEDRSATWINLHDDLRVVEGTGDLIWSSERTGFRHLELRDRDGTLIRPLTSGDWPVDGPTAGRGFRGVLAVDAGRREVWFSAAKEGPLEAQVYRVSLDGGPIERVTQEPGMHRAVVSKDGEHFIDVHSNHAQPPRTTLRDRSGRVIKVLDDAGTDPRLAELDLSPPVLATFPNRDDIQLHGAFYAPRSAVLGQAAPLIVMLYGGPQHQVVTDSWGLTADLTAQHLAGLGFAVWKMDNRGSPRRGNAFESALFRNMGEVEVRDQADGARFAASNWPGVDPDRIGVTGASYGGYLTLRCLELEPEVFRAGVAVAPVTSWDGYDTAYTERYMSTPADNPEGYRKASVLSRASDLVGEALVIHGMLDENVHFRHTARLATALIGAGRAFALLPLPDERHMARSEADRRYVASRLADFFRASLVDRGGKVTASTPPTP